jgi:hypothetical protein
MEPTEAYEKVLQIFSRLKAVLRLNPRRLLYAAQFWPSTARQPRHSMILLQS